MKGMANPSLKNGWIRFANEFFLAWMRSGPLKERVRKAIYYECWGYEERREAGKPVKISRATFSYLTGIKDKCTISKLTNELAEELVVIKLSSGPMDTPAYWPNQDYEQWIGDNIPSGDNTTSGKSATNGDNAISDETPTKTSGKITTHTIQESTRKTTTIEGDENNTSGENTTSGKLPTLCKLFADLNIPKVPGQKDHDLEDMLRERADYDHKKAIKAMERCHEKGLMANVRGWRANSLSYYEAAIIEALEGKPVKNGGRSGGGNKPRIRI